MVEDPLKIMVYSPPGHGKTTLLGTGAGDKRISPMLILEFEGGTRSIKSKIRKIKLEELGEKAPTVEKIDVIQIQKWEDFEVVYDFLESVDHGYKSLGLDSLTEMNYLNMSEALALALREDKKHDPDIPEQRDYLRSAGQMRRLVRFFRDLPMNVFFTAGASTQQDPRTREYKAWPALTGKLTFEIPGLVEVVGYLAVVDLDESADAEDQESTARWLFVQPTGKFEAKDRTEGGMLGEYIENPTLPQIFDLAGIKS